MGEMLSIIWNPDVVAIDLGFIAIRWYQQKAAAAPTSAPIA